ncbi:MAG: hypothetical protein KME42_25345 [Tildeniella nuda ZEHNDER 1965/U140]|jgi:hypothetical protein|nr:hypothetical protein [Tildeniella nuda ZEHNDER 1965/U140]
MEVDDTADQGKLKRTNQLTELSVPKIPAFLENAGLLLYTPIEGAQTLK